MANTVTQTNLLVLPGSRELIKMVAIASDGTEETDLVVYDSSAVATTLGISDPLNCRLLAVKAVVASSVITTAAPVVHLEWDATTDVLCLPLTGGSDSIDMDFRDIGGLKNPAGTGITGDITLTTTNLASGDKIVVILHVKATA